MARPSKLSPAQWADVERRLLEGERAADLAREYGVDRAALTRKFSKGSAKHGTALRLSAAGVSDAKRFASQLQSCGADESRIVMVLRLFLGFGTLESVLSVPKINRCRFEVTVAAGRIDLLLYHADGGVTIVEVKGGSNAMEVARGIGQLCMYSVLLPHSIKQGNAPKYVNLMLVAPVAPADSIDLIAACAIAGVRFVHMPAQDECTRIIQTGFSDGA